MKTIFLVPIEPIDSRYTKQWYENIPKIIGDRIRELKLDPHEVVTIAGEGANNGTTAGAFLDFAATNYYKAAQVQAISELLGEDFIEPELQLDPQQGRLRAKLYRQGAVKNESLDEQGTSHLSLRLPKQDFVRLLKEEGLDAQVYLP